MPSQEQAWDRGSRRAERRNRFGVAEIILRQGASVAVDQGGYGRPGDAEDAPDFTAYYFRDLVITFAEQFRIGGAAGKAGERGHVCGCASGEEGGIPDRTQHAQSFTARNQKSESVARVPNLIAAISCGYDSDGRVLNARK